VTADDIPSVQVDQVPMEPPADGAVLLDVRESEEWNVGHIPWAVHIPMGELLERLDEIPKERSIVVVCRSGHRSAAVTAYLAKAGWAARNLDGGMINWAATGRPMASATAAPPSVL
jgi:rhodanese-related sulfurtransferase